MFENVKGINDTTKMNYSKIYTENEVAQLFSCISPDIQDELIAVMRQMIADNKAKKEKIQA